MCLPQSGGCGGRPQSDPYSALRPHVGETSGLQQHRTPPAASWLQGTTHGLMAGESSVLV